MKVVILAGGLGTRLSEETTVRPKPMVEIGNMPIIWHIMKIYAHHGHTDFVICLGYKGYVVKEFFANYLMRQSSIKVDLAKNKIEVLDESSEPWTVSLIDTGEHSMTGGRIKRVAPYLNGERFCMTYGDGVSDIDITKSIEFHDAQNSLITMAAIQPPGRYGAINLLAGEHRVDHFKEKPVGDGVWVNGGFFVCEPEALDLIEKDSTTWEAEPLQTAAATGRLNAFRHEGFWQSMDTLRDKMLLEELWSSENPPWKVW